MRRVDEHTRLLLAARDGDELSLAAWVRETHDEVWRLCAHLTGPAAADDVTQDTYVRAWRALPAYRGDASARTWLYSIARRACADALRARARGRRLVDAVVHRRPVAHDPDAAEDHALHDLVARLPLERRTAFVLTQTLGLSYAEVATICDCPIGTVRSRVARARGELAAHLRDEPARSPGRSAPPMAGLPQPEV